MLEIVNQLDGFDSRGNIKVLMATNRPDTLDPALLRPGRLDRKVGAAASGGRRELDLLSGIPSMYFLGTVLLLLRCDRQLQTV